MVTMDNARLLIVDDEPAVREILARTLTEAGYECHVSANAQEALRRLSDCEYHLVVSDILMPGITGMELLDDIKASYPDTAVVMVTAVAETVTAVEALKNGASDYLTKPFNLDEVILSVDRSLQIRKLELENREYQEHLEQKLQEQTEAVEETFMGAVRALAGALEAKDRYTQGHSERVTEIAVMIAAEAGLDKRQLEQVKLAGTVHDIGKIGMPESILQKPGRLTAEEYEQVKQHPVIAERILEPVLRDHEVLRIVRHHHERYDGAGYPDGLESEEIPLGARIIGIADAYDAMTSDRPYRMAMTHKEALKNMYDNSGTQFDPPLTDLFIGIEKHLLLCSLPRERKAS